MGMQTLVSIELRASVERNRDQIEAIIARYGASNPRLFGSVARGNATKASDIDMLVDLDPVNGNPLLRIAGISDELSDLLGVHVDVVADELLRDRVSVTAHADAVPV